ncbi:MAG: CHAT domain-containing protein [Synechococcales cyanobacterium RU_4_20]|nr:CHAT domain-containing protein [Synechococcales cyanobacterium RU_4_20]NJR68620.1 CHAT domain-containing protein [Synechococcales cyanobacterium CRU_2_2]
MQRAGAKATIASLWQVNDSSTQVLMTDLYRGLTQGMTKAEAIQAAQVNMLDANSEFTHPDY